MKPALDLTEEEKGRLPSDGGPDYNRLVFEQSPYLLQHAANPVEWYPWGDEAFEKAQQVEKPIFLSIGYATCHWCHVMEHESFEHEAVAALLNEHYVSIKVDREERPDVDQIYMTVTQGLTGSGGWPMTVVLTPDRKPFFAGTYFPREGLSGRPGMLDLLPQLADLWITERERIVDSAEEITEWLQRRIGSESERPVGPEALNRAFQQLAERYDSEHGGFAEQPKFPTPHNLTFLLRYWKSKESTDALEMVENTLRAMRRGGVFDQIGFGIHRYSTDREWLVPHFEKMLYDQALVAIAALETFLATGKEDYADMAREIFTYVLRDMTDPAGGFYSAEDADSEGVEGKFYLWSEAEVRSVLGGEAELFLEAYGFTPEGNYVDESTRTKTGLNIPHLTGSREDRAAEWQIEASVLRARLESAREHLFEHREKRIHPLKDDKVLTDWNGLMIAALALGGRILDEEDYTRAAVRAADFIWQNLRDDSEHLLKRWRGGRAGLRGHLDDYAFFTWGMIELYETTFDPLYLDRAVALTEDSIERFWDTESNAFFFTASDGEHLLVRGKEIYDGAIPSGNSVACMNLLRLGRITARTEWERLADRLLTAFGTQVAGAPSAYTHLMGAVDFMAGPSHEIVIAGRPGSDDVRLMRNALDGLYLPNAVILFRPEMEDAPPITRLAPYTVTQRAIGGKATAYVCQDYVCNRPVTDPAEMLELLMNPKR